MNKDKTNEIQELLDDWGKDHISPYAKKLEAILRLIVSQLPKVKQGSTYRVVDGELREVRRKDDVKPDSDRIRDLKRRIEIEQTAREKAEEELANIVRAHGCIWKHEREMTASDCMEAAIKSSFILRKKLHKAGNEKLRQLRDWVCANTHMGIVCWSDLWIEIERLLGKEEA